LGARKGIAVALMGLSIYIVCFGVAAAACQLQDVDGRCQKGAYLQTVVGLSGSAIAGLCSGLLWTSQGVFLSQTSEQWHRWNSVP